MCIFKNTLGKTLRVTVMHCSHVCCFTKDYHDICVKMESSQGFISLLIFLIYSVCFLVWYPLKFLSFIVGIFMVAL